MTLNSCKTPIAIKMQKLMKYFPSEGKNLIGQGIMKIFGDCPSGNIPNKNLENYKILEENFLKKNPFFGMIQLRRCKQNYYCVFKSSMSRNQNNFNGAKWHPDVKSFKITVDNDLVTIHITKISEYATQKDNIDVHIDILSTKPMTYEEDEKKNFLLVTTFKPCRNCKINFKLCFCFKKISI